MRAGWEKKRCEYDFVGGEDGCEAESFVRMKSAYTPQVPGQKPCLVLYGSEYVVDVFLLQPSDNADCSCDGERMGNGRLCLVGSSCLFGLPVAGGTGGGDKEVVALDGGAMQVKKIGDEVSLPHAVDSCAARMRHFQWMRYGYLQSPSYEKSRSVVRDAEKNPLTLQLLTGGRIVIYVYKTN